jgi:hypothetical protein
MNEADNNLRRGIFAKGVLALLAPVVLLFAGVKLDSLIFPQAHITRASMALFLVLLAVCVAGQIWSLRLLNQCRGEKRSLLGIGAVVSMIPGAFLLFMYLWLFALCMVYFYNPQFGPLFGGS